MTISGKLLKYKNTIISAFKHYDELKPLIDELSGLTNGKISQLYNKVIEGLDCYLIKFNESENNAQYYIIFEESTRFPEPDFIIYPYSEKMIAYVHYSEIDKQSYCCFDFPFHTEFTDQHYSLYFKILNKLNDRFDEGSENHFNVDMTYDEVVYYLKNNNFEVRDAKDSDYYDWMTKF